MNIFGFLFFIFSFLMSDGATAAANAGSDKPKKAKTGPKTQKTRTVKGSTPTAISTKSAIGLHDSNQPASRFTYVLGPQEKELHDYLQCIFDPDSYSARVPNDQGGFELYTELWRTFENGVVTAGTDGTAVLGLCADSWVENGNADGVPNPASQCLGYTGNGPAAYYSNGTAASYTTFPAAGAAINIAFGANILDTPTDTALTPTTRMRLVAMKLAVHNVDAATLTKGEMMLSGTVNPNGGVRGGSLNSALWDDVAKTNDKVVSRAVRGLPNWKPGQEFAIVAIPGEAQCFEMVQYPAVPQSLTNFPFAHILLQARSMTAGDQISYRITYIWESELARSNTADGGAYVPPTVPLQTVLAATANAHKYSTAPGIAGIHALPWIETLASTNPNGVEGFSKHSSIPPSLRPVKEMSKEMVVYRPHKDNASPTSFLGKVASLGKAIVGTAAKSNVLSKIPYVGPVLQGLASALDGIFN